MTKSIPNVLRVVKGYSPIEIQNDMSGNERANYKYTVHVNDEVVEVGTIKGHNPSDGWLYLVTLVGTPPAFRSAIPVGVKVESLLTQRAADIPTESRQPSWADDGLDDAVIGSLP